MLNKQFSKFNFQGRENELLLKGMGGIMEVEGNVEQMNKESNDKV